ncbi:MAG: nicotinamide mononucleotide transporter [Bacteroidales bacterium]|nr:nicotinamide mononucleotide transporter [Candidatus Cacconaster merdequi]
MMNPLDLISSVLGLTCVFLAGRGSKYNFWVGYLYTAALFLLFREKNLAASMMLQPISLVINILGHYRWTHPKADEESSEKVGELKVSMLSWTGRCIAVLSFAAVAVLWGMALNHLFPADPHPYLDTCVTALILLAQLLGALKKWECWIVWLVVNVTQLILHLSVGNVFMPCVSALYLINGIISLINWFKLYRRKA